MKKISILLFLFISLVTLKANAQHGEYVGGDISDLPLYEEHNSGYLDGNGKKISDLITWLRDECGWNAFRVRLFVNPAKSSSEPSVCQDIDYVKTLGKRIKDAGCKFMLDFHYSDTWVDATHIQAPAECKSMTVDQKADWIYTYTKESLEALKAADATPDLVQVGNEIMYGFMGIQVHPYNSGSDDWTGYLKVLKQGCQAVRDVCPDAQIIIHTDRATNTSYNNFYYNKLNDASVPYDIIGLSFYPFWHGWLTAHPAKYNDGLITALNNLKTNFPTKKVQIVEAAYNFQYWPSSGVNYDTRDTWACSIDGQYNFIKDLIAELANHDNVNGLFYWCPEEAGNGDDTNWNSSKGTVMPSWLNRGLWDLNITQSGHKPLKATNGMVHYLFKDFLDPTLTGVNTITATPSASDSWYTLSGSRIAKPTQKGIYINGNKKVIVK